MLDLCAGTGSHAKLLAEQGIRVVGVDRSSAMIEIAGRKAPGASFIELDIRYFQTDQRFDAVICMYGAIHYLEQPQDVVRVLRLVFEHLKPGGAMILDLRERNNLPERLAGEMVNGAAYRKFWLRRRGVKNSDIYVVSAFDSSNGRHFLEAHNLFHTDPHRIAAWARMVGFQDVRLHPDYRRDEVYQRLSGENKAVLVANRPEPEKD